MGMLGNVFSVGPNGHPVGASSKRWLGDVITVGPNGPSVDESSMRLLGDVITEGTDGPSLGRYLVVFMYIHYIYILLVYMWECG